MSIENIIKCVTENEVKVVENNLASINSDAAYFTSPLLMLAYSA